MRAITSSLCLVCGAGRGSSVFKSKASTHNKNNTYTCVSVYDAHTGQRIAKTHSVVFSWVCWKWVSDGQLPPGSQVLGPSCCLLSVRFEVIFKTGYLYIIYIYIYMFFLPISLLNWISWVPVSEPGCALIFRWVIWQARYPRCPPNVSWMLQLISQMLPDASKGFPDASQPPYLRCAVDTSPQERQGKTSFSCFGACAYGQHNNNNDRK